MTLRIGVAEIDVTDLETAWEFYVETLGIRGRSISHDGPVTEFGEWGTGRGQPFELDLGVGHVVLVYRASVLAESAYPYGTGVKLVFYTDDISNTVAAWRAKGVEFIPIAWSSDPSGVADSPFGPFIAFRDPFGTIHELLQPTSPGPQQNSRQAGDREVAKRSGLEFVLEGFPKGLVSALAYDHLARFSLGLDVVGRLPADTDEPLVEKDSLRALLEPVTGEELAGELVAMLEALPGHRLRSSVVGGAHSEEAGWFSIADRVVIYDSAPDATFVHLSIAWRRATDDVVEAVRATFPNLESELLDPRIVPSRIMSLIQREHRSQFYAKLIEIDRQLGWWAALAAVLLVPLATLAMTDVEVDQSASGRANCWPLGMVVMAAAVGGWTLTVVESLLLAPSS
jgi:catechol 2,3-dioxygenase-like lactoylglutathione lyase family enzyme/uncharacterized integral membrane protein